MVVLWTSLADNKSNVMSRSSFSGLTVVDTEITFIGKQLHIRVLPLRHSKSFKMSHSAEINIRTFETDTNNRIFYILFKHTCFSFGTRHLYQQEACYVSKCSKSFGRINLTVTKSAVRLIERLIETK